ncbi:MAG: P-loop NTPase [Deltaproteobacteria bacterium]|nr:P-loop NTPase [Deltaproteobacteria bacterium]
MKLLVCGKGGSGKSTVAVLLVKSLKNRGLRVLLVDADESNVGLGRLLGSSDTSSLLDSLGGKKDLQQKMMKAFPMGKPLELFSKRWSVADIPRGCLSQTDGVQIMAIGKIQHFGEGCACPMGALAKAFLCNLDPAFDEVVVIDAEAGIEHFGRGLETGCDMILAIVDPTHESILLAQKIGELAKTAGKDLYFIWNKVSPEVEKVLSRYMNEDRVLARIPQDLTIFVESLEGRPLTAGLFQIEQISDFIIQTIEHAR